MLASVALGGPHGAVFVGVVAGVGAASGTGTVAGAVGGGVAGGKRHDEKIKDEANKIILDAKDRKIAAKDREIAKLESVLNKAGAAVATSSRGQHDMGERAALSAEEVLEKERDEHRAEARKLREKLECSEERVKVLEMHEGQLKRQVNELTGERDDARCSLRSITPS